MKVLCISVVLRTSMHVRASGPGGAARLLVQGVAGKLGVEGIKRTRYSSRSHTSAVVIAGGDRGERYREVSEREDQCLKRFQLPDPLWQGCVSSKIMQV